MSKKSKLPEELYWELCAVDEECNDMSDGAWWAMLEDHVKFYNREHKARLDENDTVHLFLERQEQERKAENK
jgi:hypothetical protein